MFRRIPADSIDNSSKPRQQHRTTVSKHKIRIMLERELHDIRRRLLKLEEETLGVEHVRGVSDRRAA